MGSVSVSSCRRQWGPDLQFHAHVGYHVHAWGHRIVPMIDNKKIIRVLV